MNNEEINLIPEKIKKGLITKKEAVNIICSFVSQNYRIYGLQKYDEDFRSEVIIKLLERGQYILDFYNPEAGCFMKYLYYYICTLIHSKMKIVARNAVQERMNIEYSIELNEEKEVQYNKLFYSPINEPSVPYARKVSNEDIITTLRNISKKPSDKKILVLAMKSSFYITDKEIEKICIMYSIRQEDFYEIIQLCKSSVLSRAERKNRALERRNYAYSQHKRFSSLVKKLSEDLSMQNSEAIITYRKKAKRYKQRWLELNKILGEGYLYLRPSNKFIADILGICERQVTYYIQCARKELEEMEQKEAEDEEENEEKEDKETAVQ